MIWYGLITLKDTPDYKSGSLISVATVIPDPAELAAKSVEAVELGDFDEGGPDFATQVFDPVTKELVDLPPKTDPVQDLLDDTDWDETDTELALRLVLAQVYGKSPEQALPPNATPTLWQKFLSLFS